MSDWRTITEGFNLRVSPEEQKQRDREGLAIKRAEREKATGRDAAALDREIARDVKRIGDEPVTSTQDWRAITRTFQPEAPAAPAAEEYVIPRYDIARGVKRTARSQVDPFESAARGAVTGMTAGLGKYVAAPAMVGLDVLAGKGDLTLKQALEEVRAQEELDRAINPKATLAGTLAGAVAPFSRLSAARQPLKTLAASTGYGAASGFSQNPAEEGSTLQDMLVGGGFGLLGGGANVGAATAIAGRLNAAALQGARDALRTGKQAVPIDVSSANLRQVFEQGGELVAKGGKKLTKKGEETLNNLNARWLVSNSAPEEVVGLARAAPYKASTRGVQGAAASVLPSTVLGGLSGAVGAPFVGQDPLTGALAGAGAGFGLGKANTMNAAREAATRAGASFATLSGVPQLGSVVSPAVTAGTATAVPELILRREPEERLTLSQRLGLR